MAVEPSPRPDLDPHRAERFRRYLFRAPSPQVSVLYAFVTSLALAGLFYDPIGVPVPFLEISLGLFFGPALAAAFLTGPLARALGGRFVLKRSSLLAFTTLAIALPVFVIWRLLLVAAPLAVPPFAWLVLFVQGPSLWLRHMSLFGVSKPSHLRSLPASALQPLLTGLVVFLLFPPNVSEMLLALLFPLLGFLSSALLLRAADRPLRREFGISGVSLIRPILDHVQSRDPSATDHLEAFFRGFSVPANIRVTVLGFTSGGRPVATLVLPTVHPGPFAALGASDLPRKLSELLSGVGGMILVPHTPCNHDLDLPTAREVGRIADAARQLIGSMGGTASRRYSPLVAPHPGSFARAQLLGDVRLVVVTQAPGPTDDIAFAVGDRLYQERKRGGDGPVALIDAHNSYREDAGDVTYASPAAEKLLADAHAAIAAAEAQAAEGALRVGVSQKAGYSTRTHGIGPNGIQALVLEAAGRRTALVLIDGNNLMMGFRAPILAGLADLVDGAELLTSDNHVVHEVDGGLNPVGERYPMPALLEDIRSVVRAASENLQPAEPHFGETTVPDVPVLGPDWTARLLTSLGDTLSMFTNAFVTTLLLLLAASLVLLVGFS